MIVPLRPWIVCSGDGAVAGFSTTRLAGLTALLAASHLADDAMRIAGAVYLVWLGITAFRRTLPRRTPDRSP